MGSGFSFHPAYRGLLMYKSLLNSLSVLGKFLLPLGFMAIALLCIGAAAHQAWSANLFTTVSDMFPKSAVASVTGIGTMAGGVGGVLVQKAAGFLRDHYPHNAYLILFVGCATIYLLAWCVIKILVPRHRPITL